MPQRSSWAGTLALSTLALIPATWLGSQTFSPGTLAGDERHGAGVWTHDAASDDSRPFLGVELEEEIDHPAGGARIVRVVDDSAAAKTGLEAGDIIVGFDGRTIRGPGALSQSLREKEPGDRVSITVVRDGQERGFDVELGERPGIGFFHAGPQALVSGCDEDDEDCDPSFSWSCSGDDCEGFEFDFGGFGRKPLLGVQLVHVTDELREHLGGAAGRGVLVSKIVSGSAAEGAGIAVGDLIVGVGGQPVESAEDLREVLEKNEGGTIEVEVIRDRHARRIEVSLPGREAVAPSGPRALRVVPHGALDDLDRHIEEALERAHETLRRTLESHESAPGAVSGRPFELQRKAVRVARDRYDSV